jgi:hypothetical protein
MNMTVDTKSDNGNSEVSSSYLLFLNYLIHGWCKNRTFLDVTKEMSRFALLIEAMNVS